MKVGIIHSWNLPFVIFTESVFSSLKEERLSENRHVSEDNVTLIDNT